MGDERPVFDLERVTLTADDIIKCLNGELDIILPTPGVKPCNNLEEYLHKSTLNTRTPDRRRSSGQFKPPPRAPFAVPLVRNFERNLKRPTGNEQLTPGTSLGLVRKLRKKRPDVFSRMDEIETSSGPLSQLKEGLNKTIKVLIRRRRKVPYISRTIEYKGKLMMFDKHMNLYMSDVIESFKYKTDDDKILKRARHRRDILLRGDNIILVSSKINR